MALIDQGSLSPEAIYDKARRHLLALRQALTDISDFQAWLAAVPDADLVAIGADPNDIAALKSAMADADQFHELYTAGALSGSYSLPYAFGSSQRLFIGPRTLSQ